MKDKESKIKKAIKKVKKSKIFKEEDKNSYSFKEMIFVMVFSLILGFFACFSIYKVFNSGKDYIVLSKDLSKLVDTYYALVDNYYEDIDKELLVDDAIKGMLSSVGDVYTNYSDTDSTLTFKETVDGSYEGIGAMVGQTTEGDLIVVEIFKNSPSDKAGLKVGDIITKIDGQDFIGKTSTDVSNYIKNNENKTIILTIKRDEEIKEIKLERDLVEMPTVSSEIYESEGKKIGYVSISIFSSTTTKQFKNALNELNKDKIDGLIIDVRDNGGGYLSVVTDIASEILEKNKVIYKLEKDGKITEKKDTTKEKIEYPIAILVNSNSASAAEILAAAIKESCNGIVVGTNTYGKGTVQQTTTLPDGSMVKYTVQKWLTPNGNWIEGKGVTPTEFIELDEKYYNNPIKENDNQLNKAIELVGNKIK